MVHFIQAFRVQLLLWTLFLASTNPINIQGSLPETGIISSFLERFIKPYIEHIHVSNGSPRAVAQENKIDNIIRLKVAQLKHLLQDNEGDKPKTDSDDNLTLQGNDETTIIEFIPKVNIRKKGRSGLKNNNSETDSFQKNIKKYKHLKRTIKKLLEKERTASSTQDLITRTLDNMIATMIESQCTWKGVNPIDIKNHLLKSNSITRKSMNKLHNLTNKEWMTLRKQYLNFLKFNVADEQNTDFVEQFHEFFTNVINDTLDLSKRYKVRCQLVQVSEQANSKQYLREDKMVEKNQCDSFKVCSDELKDFLANFYSYLNDTAVSTFRNYAAMYIRDVNADIGVDKDIVVSVIENLSNNAEHKVIKVFKKELDKFTLDENKKKGANIQYISEFITSTTDQVRKVLKKNLDHELGAMKTKLFATVKEDLTVNLKADMYNLGKLFVDRICALFVLCNGRYSARRQGQPWTFIPKRTDDVYVKVQLTLDDELKESIARMGSNMPGQDKDLTHRFAKSFGIVENKYSNFSVTRTTPGSSINTGHPSKNYSMVSKTLSLPMKKRDRISFGRNKYGGMTLMINNI